MKFSAQSDSNSGRYSVFPERGGFIFLTVQLILPPIFINAPRPWACRGMPFDDVYQNMFERVSLGAGISIRSSMWRVWVGPLARSCVWGFPTSKSRSDFRDLVNYPYDLAEIWHTYPPRHGEDDFLLTFFPLNIFC